MAFVCNPTGLIARDIVVSCVVMSMVLATMTMNEQLLHF